MTKKNMLAAMICGVALCSLTGCGLLTSENLSGIRQTVVAALEIAYEAGGKELAAAKIDELVTEGKITSEQAETLKQAVQNSYDSFIARLNELAETSE